MAKIIQVLDVGPAGHSVRLDNGRTVVLPHDGIEVAVGREVEDLRLVPRVDPKPDPVVIPPSIEFLNSDTQVQANILSEIVQPHVGESDASSEPSTAGSDGDRREEPEQAQSAE